MIFMQVGIGFGKSGRKFDKNLAGNDLLLSSCPGLGFVSGCALAVDEKEKDQ